MPWSSMSSDHEQASRTCLHEIMEGTTFCSQPLCLVREDSTWVSKSWSMTSWYRMFMFSSHPPWIDTYTFVKAPRQFLVLSCYANTASTHIYTTGYNFNNWQFLPIAQWYLQYWLHTWPCKTKHSIDNRWQQKTHPKYIAPRLSINKTNEKQWSNTPSRNKISVTFQFSTMRIRSDCQSVRRNTATSNVSRPLHATTRSATKCLV